MLEKTHTSMFVVVAGLGVALSVLIAMTTACTGGGSSSSGGFVGSGTATARKPPIGAPGASDPGGGFAPPPPNFPGGKPAPPPSTEDIEAPFVACTDEPIGPTDAGGGMDAGDASSTTPVGSPCETPPADECVSGVYAAKFFPGYCDGTRCQFPSALEECRGGCFTQIDGGNRCNP